MRIARRRMATRQRARTPWLPLPRAGGGNDQQAPHLSHCRRQGHDARRPQTLHKYMLEIERIDHISDEMRAVVEELWPDLAHKLPPKRPQS
jgi:hypothetical protein